MFEAAKEQFVGALRWSERYTKTDMVYLAESGFWLNLTSILLSLFAFGLYIVFANTLSKETFGTYQYLLTLAALVSSFTLTGMNFAVMQAVPRGFEGTFQKAVSAQIRFGIIALIVSCLGALYYILQGNFLLAKGLLIIGFFVPFISAFNTFGSYLVGKKMFKESFLYSMCLYVPLYALLAITAFTIGNPLVLLGVNLGVQAILLAAIYRSILRVAAPNDAVDSESLSFGKRLSAVNFLGAAVGQIDNLLAFHYLGPVPLAVYSFATAIPDRLGGLLKFIYTAALPKFAVRPLEEIQSGIFGKVWRTALVALVAAVAYALVAPLFFKLFFPAYASSVPYSQLYALTMLSYATNIWVAALISQRFLREYAIFSISTSVVQTIIQLAGILIWGLWGLIVAKLISNLLSGAVASVLFLLKRDRDVTSS